MLTMAGLGGVVGSGRPVKREPAQLMIIMLGFAQPSPESQLMLIMLGLGCVTQLLQGELMMLAMLAQPSAEPAQLMLMMLRFRGVLGRTQRS